MDQLRLLLLFFFSIISTGTALMCIQCGNNEAWYSEEEHERRIEACRHGLIAPTRCKNTTLTHCIVSWYRTGGSNEKMVTERRCGTSEDDTGCTLYNSKISRKVRHLLNSDSSSSSQRKETATTFVEVCSQSCPFGECVNTSTTNSILSSLISMVFLTLFL
ncbi:unnamed protein product [Caenorhabditis auriculariae]|uniref:Uncharacterized protein n=1 Tax=Caenorhabditis auriculariae TaxID=2777116 RepID=A0A8S1H0J7_9PELO|nr:unnamed protein product [Caenorhabditis auriculariae]